MSRRKQYMRQGLTSQGVKNLGNRPTKRIEMPNQDNRGCDHFGLVQEIDANSGVSQCHRCKQKWDFSGNPL